MATLSGGQALEKKLEEMAKRMSQKEVKIGFMGNATYDDGTPVAAVAFWNEYGTSKIPARPFFRNMIAQSSPGWSKMIANAANQMDFDGQKVLAFMGEYVANELKMSINEFSTPANAPSTIARKGFNKPLIQDGHMRDSITYEVTE